MSKYDVRKEHHTMWDEIWWKILVQTDTPITTIDYINSRSKSIFDKDGMFTNDIIEDVVVLAAQSIRECK